MPRAPAVLHPSAIPFFPSLSALSCFAILPLFSAAPAFSAAAAASVFTVRTAVFSDRQLFWPQLAGQGRPALPQTLPALPPARPASAPKTRSGTKGTGGTESSDAARIAILPVTLRDYHESLACDSCHRLSANGMEFFLENYLKDRMQARFPDFSVELIHPDQPLIESKLPLMAYLDSLDFPWSQWFPDSSEPLIYRPRDRFVKPAARKRMDKLGGMLGASHLLLPCRMYVRATPKSSITHEGGLDWGFSLVFWNVAAGGPEWAIRYSDAEGNMNLDDALDGRLDRSLGAVWSGLSAELTALWAAEPR